MAALRPPKLDAGSDTARALRQHIREVAETLTRFMAEGVNSGATTGSSAITTPETYGAIGDGVVDDTAALQTALNTGRSLILTDGKRYKTTAALTIPQSYQGISGNGILVPVGTFDAITFAALADVCYVDCIVDAAGQTGYAVSIKNANRIIIKKLMLLSGYNGIYVEQSNSSTIEWFYASGLRGAYAIRWYGDAGKRSDVLTIVSAVWSFVAGVYGTGIDWDGNCNSLTVFFAGQILGGYAIRIRNTSGGPPPVIGRFYEAVADFTQYDGIRIDTATADLDFIGTYSQGSTTGSGIYVAAGSAADTIRLIGGKFTGNARYGIETSPRVQVINTDLTFNTIGEVSGSVAACAPRFEVFSGRYLGVDGSNNLLLVGGTNTFLQNVNSTGEWVLYSGAAAGLRQSNSAGAATMGFYGASPVARPSGAAQAALTDSTGGTASTTLAAIAAGAAYAQADMVAVKNAIASLANQTNALRSALVSINLIKGSA